MGHESRFIESEKFPISIISEKSAKEAVLRSLRPAFWDMVFWWAKLPLTLTRSIILGALLPSNISADDFLEMLRIKERAPHRLNPKIPEDVYEKHIKDKTLLDPFACYGNISLEAIRLGLSKVVAVELLPVGYVFLKAILEYPKKYGRFEIEVEKEKIQELGLDKILNINSTVKRHRVPSLVYDVARLGKWIVERLKEDPDLRVVYDDNVIAYIGTWEVKCPKCGNYTPLISNWWLARIRGAGGYKRLTFMRPVKAKNEVSIEIVEGKSEGVASPNIRGRPELAECLLCGNRITYIDPETSRTYTHKKEVEDEDVRNRLEFYPKYALNDWNRKLEEYLEGRISLEELKNAKARPRLLVKAKIVGKDLKFEPCNEEDNEKLWKALKIIKKLWQKGDPDIPREIIVPYERSWMVTRYGIDKFYKLFNPRQLLTLVKLVKLIRQASKRLEEEKLKQGLSKGEVHDYVEAVATYLAILMCRCASHNTFTTKWDPLFTLPRQVFTFRGVDISWSVAEYNVLNAKVGLPKHLAYIVNGLTYLLNAVKDSPSEVEVLLDDATTLHKFSPEERFDLIIMDPPRYDYAPYAELSDFYFIWLKRALSDVKNGKLAPKFLSEAFFDKTGSETPTQWERYAPKEVSLNIGRYEYFNQRKHSLKEAIIEYTNLLASVFTRITQLLKDDGILITYLMPKEWDKLLEVGRVSKLEITAIHPVIREIIIKVKNPLEADLIIVWRKRKDKGKIDVSKPSIVNNLKRIINERIRTIRAKGPLLIYRAYEATLCELSKYAEIYERGKLLTQGHDINSLAYRLVLMSLFPSIRTKDALCYLAIKVLYGGYRTRGERLRIPLDSLLELCHILKHDLEELEKKNIVRKRVMKYELVEPIDDRPESIEEVLVSKNISWHPPKGIRTSIDVLQILEYVMFKGKDTFESIIKELKGTHPSLYEEALEIVKIMLGDLVPEKDPEKRLCKLLARLLQLDSRI